MAVVIIRDPLSGRDFQSDEGHRMYLYTESGQITLAVPIAPREIEYSSFVDEWVQTERSGNTPLLLRKAPRLEQIAFSVLVTDKTTMHAGQTGAINAARALATTRERVLIRYSVQESGLWRITDGSFSSQLRHPVTNEITRGMLSLTLTRANDAAPAVGPVTGGTQPPPTGSPSPAPPRTYTVVARDSLWKIAQRYYGKGELWPRIFDANRNKIKNPHWIYINQVFVIP